MRKRLSGNGMGRLLGAALLMSLAWTAGAGGVQAEGLSTAYSEVEPNNSFDAATKLTLGTTCAGDVSYENDVDYYSFVLDKPAEVNIRVVTHDNYAGSDSVRLYMEDAKGNKRLIASEGAIGFTGFSSMTLPGGTYYLYLDCYESFGWQQDENFPPQAARGKVALKLKRDRRILNKTELTRLQRHFEADLAEIAALECSKTTAANFWALLTALLGTAFMAGATFAAVAEPPIVWLCILLAIPGFGGWIAPVFLYRAVRDKKARQVQPFIEAKLEEIYEICEKGQNLLL